MSKAIIPIVGGFFGVGAIVTLMASTFVVDEGHIGVETRMGQAVAQHAPAGLQWITPFVSGITEFDVRERTMTETARASTSNRISIEFSYSVNWQPQADAILDIYRNYGTPEIFQAETMRPRLNQAMKAAVGQFTDIQLVQNRNEVAAAMAIAAREILDEYPANIISVQLDGYQLPQAISADILATQQSAQQTLRAQQELERQRIESQQMVQTAEAARDAEIARADGAAYATLTEAQAEAEAIRLLAEAEADGLTAIENALSGNPLLVQYTQVENWDGVLPTMMLGDSTEMLLTLPSN